MAGNINILATRNLARRAHAHKLKRKPSSRAQH
jgi:hypothetical protein